MDGETVCLVVVTGEEREEAEESDTTLPCLVVSA